MDTQSSEILTNDWKLAPSSGPNEARVVDQFNRLDAETRLSEGAIWRLARVEALLADSRESPLDNAS